MGLLHEIQSSLMAGGDLGPTFLKLRYLASKLGSNPLQEWVAHESEGYPAEVDVPEYRKATVVYRATFMGPFGAMIKNQTIPPYMVEQLAGKEWLETSIKESIPTIVDLISAKGMLTIDASNMMLLLGTKVYSGYQCASVDAEISRAIFQNILNTVRNRLLTLTLQIEQSIPVAALVTVGEQKLTIENGGGEKLTQITNNVIYGNQTTITNSGHGATFAFNNKQGDKASLIKSLVDAGIGEPDAETFAEIIASETPASAEEPFGTKAKEWIADNIGKAVKGTWKIGLGAAEKVLAQAAVAYYGIGPS